MTRAVLAEIPRLADALAAAAAEDGLPTETTPSAIWQRWGGPFPLCTLWLLRGCWNQVEAECAARGVRLAAWSPPLPGRPAILTLTQPPRAARTERPAA